jgi:hypothetical protein
MFSTCPTNGTSWYVTPGPLQAARQIDLLLCILHEDPHVLQDVAGEKPLDIRHHLKEEWWRTYFEGIWDENNTALRLPLGQYFAAAGMP